MAWLQVKYTSNNTGSRHMKWGNRKREDCRRGKIEMGSDTIQEVQCSSGERGQDFIFVGVCTTTSRTFKLLFPLLPTQIEVSAMLAKVSISIKISGVHVSSNLSWSARTRRSLIGQWAFSTRAPRCYSGMKFRAPLLFLRVNLSTPSWSLQHAPHTVEKTHAPVCFRSVQFR